VLKAPTLILDGEVCVFAKNLVSQFRLLAAWAVVKERGVRMSNCDWAYRNRAGLAIALVRQ
jgi:hypothetical protein